MRIKKTGKKNLHWGEKDLGNLSLAALRVLNVFIETGKSTLEGKDIREALKGRVDGRSLGGAISSLGKYKRKEPLLAPLVKASYRNRLWEFNEKYRDSIKSHLEKIKKYL